MLTERRIVAVVCDVCKVHGPGETNAKMAREAALDADWEIRTKRRKARMGWREGPTVERMVCPDCQGYAVVDAERVVAMLRADSDD